MGLFLEIVVGTPIMGVADLIVVVTAKGVMFLGCVSVHASCYPSQLASRGSTIDVMCWIQC